MASVPEDPADLPDYESYPESGSQSSEDGSIKMLPNQESSLSNMSDLEETQVFAPNVTEHGPAAPLVSPESDNIIDATTIGVPEDPTASSTLETSDTLHNLQAAAVAPSLAHSSLNFSMKLAPGNVQWELSTPASLGPQAEAGPGPSRRARKQSLVPKEGSEIVLCVVVWNDGNSAVANPKQCCGRKRKLDHNELTTTACACPSLEQKLQDLASSVQRIESKLDQHAEKQDVHNGQVLAKLSTLDQVMGRDDDDDSDDDDDDDGGPKSPAK